MKIARMIAETTPRRLPSCERTNKHLNHGLPLKAQGLGYQAARRGFHVLVVDDNRDAAESLCALLRIWGFECQACYDAIDALRVAREYRPDCLVVDTDMPGLVGHTLVEKLRMHPGFGRVKFIALSFRSDEAHVRSSRAAGCDFHLVKPTANLQMQRLKMLMDTLSALA